MQEQKLNDLVNLSFSKEKIFDQPEKLQEKFRKMAFENNKAFEVRNLPDVSRTPTPEELEQMHNFAADYKNYHKQASKREVRKAVQNKFNIRIFR